MPTVVEYTDKQPPRNDYPDRIVSPTHPGRCCTAHEAVIGGPQVDGQWLYEYRRCAVCGFTVRRILQRLPDLQAIAGLQEAFRSQPGRYDAAVP